MYKKLTSILKEIMKMMLWTVIIIIGFTLFGIDENILVLILGIFFFITIALKIKILKIYKIAIGIALVAVIIMAIPSKNDSYTECGVGSIYTKHYSNYDGYRELSSEGCDVTISGAIKLTGAFISFFYISLLLLERREKENEIKNKSKKIKKDTDEEIKTKIDDNDYEDIPF